MGRRNRVTISEDMASDRSVGVRHAVHEREFRRDTSKSEVAEIPPMRCTH